MDRPTYYYTPKMERGLWSPLDTPLLGGLDTPLIDGVDTSLLGRGLMEREKRKEMLGSSTPSSDTWSNGSNTGSYQAPVYPLFPRFL